MKGTARKFSDLDIAIKDSSPIPLMKLGLLREAFDSSQLPWTVDIVDWATTSEKFRLLIEDNYIILQSR